MPSAWLNRASWFQLLTFFLILFGCSLIILSPSAIAQSGGGMSPDMREVIQNLSKKEQKKFRSLSKGERRKFIMKRMSGPPAKKPETETPPPSQEAQTLEGFVPLSEISEDILIMVGKNKNGDAHGNVALQKARGGIETGLEPSFIGGAACPEIDSEKWAIDYTGKRSGAAIHKGIDIPQPRGTPIRAVAAGTVVGKFLNDGNRKGIEIMLRHTPDQTGLPFWTYSQYTHLQDLPSLEIGAKVSMGQEIGKTSNTGKMGKRVRRDALHFAVLYSAHSEWSASRRFIVPKDGYWMDPNAFYRSEIPIDSVSMAARPKDQKKIPVPYMKTDGSFVPANTKRIWPYPCP